MDHYFQFHGEKRVLLLNSSGECGRLFERGSLILNSLGKGGVYSRGGCFFNFLEIECLFKRQLNLNCMENVGAY